MTPNDAGSDGPDGSDGSDGADDFSPLAGTEVHHLRSRHVDDVFKIFIGHCGDTSAERPAVLYITDANGLFGGAVDLIRLMQHRLPDGGHRRHGGRPRPRSDADVRC